MLKKNITLIATMLLLSAISNAQNSNDSSSIGLRLNATAFFDNKEFTGDFKKGYTLPGFLMQPSVDYKIGNFYLNAGVHVHYLAGADSINAFLPILALKCRLLQNLDITVGTLQYSTHNLPEQLYKPERVFMDLPNLGIELMLNKPKFRADVWMNWERYIKKGSPFQEEFMVGVVLNYRQNTFSSDRGFSASLYEVATHAGGQIDATDLPVTTISNTGLKVGYGFPFIKEFTICPELSGYYSVDASPNPHLHYKDGSALQANIAILNPKVRFDIGFWHAQRFINPRGEELYSSVSSIDSLYNRQNRNLITTSFNYLFKAKNGFEIGFRTGLYVDIDNLKQNISGGAFEYYYTLIMKFNNRIFTKNDF